jgi:hypothetical protein
VLVEHRHALVVADRASHHRVIGNIVPRGHAAMEIPEIRCPVTSSATGQAF